MGLADTHFLGADLRGDHVDHIALDGEGQIQLAIPDGEHQRIAGIAQPGALFMLHGGHAGHLTVEQFAGGHQRGGDMLLDILIDFRLHILHQHGIRNLIRLGIDGAVVPAQKLHAQHHRRHDDHQDHQQVHDIDLAEQTALFIHHLLHPPRL
jgi:hypothetical protein